MNIRMLTRLFLGVAIFAGATGCKQHRAGSVVGSWSTDTDGVHVQMTLNPDNTWQMKGSGPSAPGKATASPG